VWLTKNGTARLLVFGMRAQSKRCIPRFVADAVSRRVQGTGG
jgi:hypothetical protein